MGRPRSDGTPAQSKRDPLKEKHAAVKAFITAMDGIEAIMSSDLTEARLPELSDFLIALESAGRKANKARSALKFAHDTLERLQAAHEKLRTVGQSDAIPAVSRRARAPKAPQGEQGAAL